MVRLPPGSLARHAGAGGDGGVVHCLRGYLLSSRAPTPPPQSPRRPSRRRPGAVGCSRGTDRTPAAAPGWRTAGGGPRGRPRGWLGRPAP
eukprot:741068-Pyramimonas_sp.AAC.1